MGDVFGRWIGFIMYPTVHAVVKAHRRSDDLSVRDLEYMCSSYVVSFSMGSINFIYYYTSLVEQT